MISAFIYDLGDGTEWTLSKLTDSTKVRGVADIYQRVTLPSRGTSTGWRSGMTGTTWNSRGKSCIWGRTIPSNSTF